MSVVTKGKTEEFDAKPVTNSVGDRMAAHRRESSRHLGQKDDAYRADDDRPSQLEAERGASLRRRRQQPHLQKAPNARHNAEEKSRAAFSSVPLRLSTG
ncbi:hypothetical protein QFZ97_008666 [Paraburkholderia youngii]